MGHGLGLKNTFSEFHKNMWIQAAAELGVAIKSYPGGFYNASCKGKSTWIKDYMVATDSYAMLQVARNKPLVSEILMERGIPVPPFLAFTINNMNSAKEFLHLQKTSCVVKPAIDGAGGLGVTTNIKSVPELKRAALFASSFSQLLMIERQITGDVYRLLFLDGKLIDAIRRIPPHVAGDGYSSIRSLIKKENKRRLEEKGSLSLKVLIIDFDCKITLKRAGLSLSYVPEAGEKVAVKSATNESNANDCESITDLVNQKVIEACRKAVEQLGLNLAGIDLITNDIRQPLDETGGVIIEINAMPGLHYHYQVRNREKMIPVAIPILKNLLDIN